MINVDNKIRNIYYMLCYSFNRELLTENEISSVASESFENIYNLFSIILCMMIRKQTKKGMSKEYINVQESLSTVKGRINMAETIRTNSLIQKKINCEYDEFSENNQLNKIIKTTATYLIKSSKIGNTIKIELKKTLIYFNNVNEIDIRTINWKNLIFNRNNNSYKSIIVLCELILKGLIASDKKGTEKFREFLDDTALNRIYENFVKEYYRKHYTQLKVGSRNLYLTPETMEYIGMMRTDITLETDERMLIIDTKFYSKILYSGRFLNSQIIDSGNLYQINTYVENQLQKTNKDVEGMLLYAQTIDEPSIDMIVPLNQKKIHIKTLDLNSSWEIISGKLNDIADKFINKS